MPPSTFAVSVIWNGTTLAGPTLIYHDELILDGVHSLSVGDINRPGALVCRSSRPRATWRLTDGDFIQDTTSRTAVIQHIRNGPTDTPSLSRLSRGSSVHQVSPSVNGLFTCRVYVDNDLEETLANFIHVGVYARGGGEHL